MTSTRRNPDPLPTHSTRWYPTVAIALLTLGACDGTPAAPPPPAPAPEVRSPPPSIAPEVLARVAEKTHLAGICEPSGAARDTDGNTWVVDDDQDHTLFRWTPAGGAPTPVPLGDPDAKPPVEDMEGLTWSGGALWVLGSHSRSRKGKLKRRARIIATRPDQPGTPDHITSLWPEKSDPTSASIAAAIAAHCPGCVDDHDLAALNLEGILESATAGRLLVGARAPLSKKGHALLFTIDARTGDKDRAPTIHDVTELNLGGRGVRALSPGPSSDLRWVLAGPPADVAPGAGGFALYIWGAGSEPRLVARLPPLAGSPEAIVPVDAQSVWLLVDEGDRLKVLSEAGEGAPHRHETEDGAKFRCGVGADPGNPEHWAQAVRVEWPKPVSSDASIR